MATPTKTKAKSTAPSLAERDQQLLKRIYEKMVLRIKQKDAVQVLSA